MAAAKESIRWFEDLGSDDTPHVGGKNASLGEMIHSLKERGVNVPDGFATTAKAYREYLRENELEDRIRAHLRRLGDKEQSLEQTGEAIRRMLREGRFPKEVDKALRDAYRELSEKYGREEVDVAVRSSATAEDLPDASFAGQQETFLNIRGEEDLLDACKRCYASLFTDRAISYRNEKGFDHLKVALSVGVQKMVRSDAASAGVMFSIDTDTGFPHVVMIDGAWGLGENVVQGTVVPDEYVVFKPLLGKSGLTPIVGKSLGAKRKKMTYAKGGDATTKNVDTSTSEQQSFTLTDEEVLRLAEWAALIEKHYERPMDMEWAKDGESGELFVVQARPETVQSQKQSAGFKTYRLGERSERIAEGIAIGQAIASGKAQVLRSPEERDRFEDGAVLVTGMTDPDWGPIIKRASGIITDHGGRTSHAAIVSRELGIPAVVGAGDATDAIDDGAEITLSCAEGNQGYIYKGKLPFDVREVDPSTLPEPPVQVMINIASPDGAFRWWRLPVKGIGLARMEFIVNNAIKIHPMALAHFDQVEDDEARKQIERLTRRYDNKEDYFVDNLARGIARIAASQWPEQVILRMSDFKTNEYANLIGGKQFEPSEENPMLGFRGASRYYNDRYRDGFALECRAVKKVRDEIGLENLLVMIPFCRSPEEADRVLEVMADNGLRRGERGLQVYVMCEIPSNVVLAREFAERFDGFSIGSNDLTQLVMGVDRDSGELKGLFDERNEAVKQMIREVIEKAHAADKKVGICGQAPSDYPDFAHFLVESGIDSLSLNPDSVVEVIERIGEAKGA